MSEQSSLFSVAVPSLVSTTAAEARKAEGLALATAPAWRQERLALARQIAIEIALEHGEVDAAQVRERYEARHGGWDLGNAAGSLFPSATFVYVRSCKSNIESAHARRISVWRLRKESE